MEWANDKEYDQWHTAQVQRCTQFKTEAKRVQEDLLGFGGRLLAFGDRAQSFFMTPDNIGKDFRAFTVRVNEEMTRIEQAVAAITSTLDASLHLGEGIKKTIQLRDRAKASLDSAAKHKDRGEKDSKRYADFQRQHNEISEQLKSEVSLLRDSEDRHSTGNFRQLLLVQRDSLRRLAALSETLCTFEPGSGGPSAAVMPGSSAAAMQGGVGSQTGGADFDKAMPPPAPTVMGPTDTERGIIPGAAGKTPSTTMPAMGEKTAPTTVSAMGERTAPTTMPATGESTAARQN
jgi:hypothetical protein